MERELHAIADLVMSNRKVLAGYMRQKLVAADAKPYLDRLGKEGIDALDREAAGILLDIACALLRRLDLEREFQPEEILTHLPENVQRSVQLPRSQAYHKIQADMRKDDLP